MVDKQEEVKSILDKFAACKEAWTPIYQKAREDLLFLSDDEAAQWNEQEYNDRRELNRPCVTIDQLGQFINQVVNDARQNTPTIKILPSKGTDKETAKVVQGLIRNIEYESDADEAYDTALEFAVKCSIGYIRVDHEYEDEDSFNQKFVISRVVDPLLIFLDNESIEADGSDAKYGYVLEAIKTDKFKKKYGEDKEAKSFPADSVPLGKDEMWLAEYFKIDEIEQEIGLLATGEVIPLDGAPVLFDIVAKRKIERRIVRRMKLSGCDILEETIFPGDYIPLIPVYGQEMWRDGKRHLHSLIRRAKDSQWVYNLSRSLQLEVLMKQPQAPLMADAQAIAKYKKDYQNPAKAAVLRFDSYTDDGKPLAPPSRLSPPMASDGYTQSALQSIEDIKASIGGIYNASLGLQGNEVSGLAINARKQEGDNATYHFADNLVRSITQVGKIIVSGLGEVYDTPRILKIVDLEENIQTVGINGAAAPEQERMFDLANAKFDVKVVTGASYTTKRQEATQFLREMMSASPVMFDVAGDLLAENMDFAGAQALANRLKKRIDPALLDDKADPQVMALQAQIQQLQEQLTQATALAESLNAQLIDKSEQTEAKVMADANDTETDRLKLLLENKKLDQQMEIEQSKLELEALKSRVEIAKIQQPKDVDINKGLLFID